VTVPLAGYSAVPIFTTMMISTFNMIFTACPIVAYAVLEQDLKKGTVLKNPETYSQTRTATRVNFFWCEPLCRLLCTTLCFCTSCAPRCQIPNHVCN
jgi:hypothetical protein